MALKCIIEKSGLIALLAVFIIAAFIIPSDAAISTDTYSDVEVNLSTAGNDNWTESGSYEYFSFNLTNSNATLEINEINITVPSSGGYSLFTVNMSTKGTDNSSWTCYSQQNDSAGNVSVLTCNTSTDNITNGDTLGIFFFATAAMTSSEDVHYWTVEAFNLTPATVTLNLSSGIDGAGPAVTLSTPGTNTWNAAGDVEFDFSANDSNAMDNCTVWLDNGTAWVSTNGSVDSPVDNTVYNITINGTSDGSYIWNVECSDTFGNSAFSAANRTINVGNRSNIIVSSIIQHGSVAPYDYYNITVNVTLTNNGTANVSKTTTLTVYFDDDNAPLSSPLKVSTYTIYSYQLNYSGSYTVQPQFYMNTTADRYWVMAVADSGLVETEQSEGDNTLTETFDTVFNVSINSVTRGAFLVKPNVNVTQDVVVNVTVLYSNGTPASGLELLNFSIYDTWIAKDMGRTESNAMNSSAVLSDFDDSADASGIYIFNYSVVEMQFYSHDDLIARYAEYGLHRISVKAVGNNTCEYYTGTSTARIAYNITAPFLDGVEGIDGSVRVGDEDEGIFQITNNGNENISVTITISADVASSILDLDDWNGTGGTVNTVGLSIGQMKAVNGTVQAISAGVTNFTLNVTFTHEGEFYFFNFLEEVEVEAASTGGDDDTTTTTTTTTPTIECTRDSDCDSDEECKSLKCVELDCDDGYVASDHECKLKSVYEIAFKNATFGYSLLQDDVLTAKVFIKNTGNKDITVELDTSLEVDGLEINISPSEQTIADGKEGLFVVLFTTAEDAKVGINEGTFKATTDFSTAKAEQAFTVTIEPLPATIAKIKTDYPDYTSRVNSMFAELEAAKAWLTEGNLTLAEAKAVELEALLNSLTDAMDSEDFVHASMYMDDIDALLSDARSILDASAVPGASFDWNTIFMWIMIVVVVAGAAGLLFYMMAPTKGYALGKGYVSQSGTKKLSGIITSIRESFTSKPTSAGQIVQKYRPTAYGSAYSKLPITYRPPARTMQERMKKAMKR
ncbi:MAG: hypothetical protein JW789_04485 [Candidatus Aenigmarchaeota archaeon]|nr:hypothetical protein [Candidatus Aenigmarchaeota archaeon]